jgi:hypothetical protein
MNEKKKVLKKDKKKVYKYKKQYIIALRSKGIDLHHLNLD